MSDFSYLISSGNNPKTIKSDKGGVYLTAILNLYPGASNVCPWATKACVDACLHTSGNPAYQAGKERARKARLELFQSNRPEFERRLRLELARHVRKAQRLGVIPAFRPNGTSDITWEKIFPGLFADFPTVQFYDYTKGAHRCFSAWVKPANYDLTLSFSGQNWDKCEKALQNGGRVAVVFGGVTPKQPLPKQWRGFPVHDGDVTDLTFTRPAGILGLRAKGKARKDYLSGFVRFDHRAVNARELSNHIAAKMVADTTTFAPKHAGGLWGFESED